MTNEAVVIFLFPITPLRLSTWIEEIIEKSKPLSKIKLNKGDNEAIDS